MSAPAYTLTFSQAELQALGACYAAALLGPDAPGISAGLHDAAGIALVKIQSALWSTPSA